MFPTTSEGPTTLSIKNDCFLNVAVISVGSVLGAVFLWPSQEKLTAGGILFTVYYRGQSGMPFFITGTGN